MNMFLNLWRHYGVGNVEFGEPVSIEYPSSRKKEHGCHGFDGYARI
jgi:hypothetical protein